MTSTPNGGGTPEEPMLDPDDDEHLDRSIVIGMGGKWLSDWALRLVILMGAGWMLYKVGGTLWVGILPILLAIILSTVLWPPVRWMTRHRVPPALAALVSVVGAIGVVVGILALVAPSIISQSTQLADRATDGIHQVQTGLEGPPLNVRDEQIDKVVKQVTDAMQSKSEDIANGVFTGVSAVGEMVVTLLLVLVLTFFFIKDGPRFLPWVRGMVGRRAGMHLTEVLARSWNTLSGFIKAQAIVSFVDAVCIGIGLVLLGVPLAWALAVITFLGGFIPIIGGFTAGTLGVMVALVANGPVNAAIVLVLIVAVMQLEGHILQPFLQSKAMNLHPVIVLLVVAAGGTLYGIVGAFLAVPFAAVAAVVLRYLGEQIDLRTGDVVAADVKTFTAEGRLTAWLAELSSTRFAALRPGRTETDTIVVSETRTTTDTGEAASTGDPRDPDTVRAHADGAASTDDADSGDRSPATTRPTTRPSTSPDGSGRARRLLDRLRGR